MKKKIGSQGLKHAYELVKHIECSIDHAEALHAEISRLEAREAFRMLSIYLNFDLIDRELDGRT